MAELDPRIRIRAPLRCDGIGRLDCAEDAESGGRMAVRWLPLDANGVEAVSACARLPVHPTLPRIHQTGQVGASAFVAMDFPEGQLLSTRLGERLDMELVLRIGVQLADALATVHAQGLLHGELSADSVLLVPPDRATLWDMPLVIANRLTDRRGESRIMQNLPRTAPYLAPERACGGEPSLEGDVYSLGALLCIAAGAPMPSAPTTLGMVNLVATGAWECRAPSTIPDPWRSMLVRMVQADPSKRPTAHQVAQLFKTAAHPESHATVREMPVVHLSPELTAQADLLVRAPLHDDTHGRPTLEMPIVIPAEARRAMTDVATGRETPTVFPAVAAKPFVVAAEVAALQRAVVVEPGQHEDVLEVSQADVVRLTVDELASVAPTAPRPVLEAVAAPVVAAKAVPLPFPAEAAPAVSLTETLSVSADLAAAGARAMTLEVPVVAGSVATAPQQRSLAVLAAGFAVALLVLLVAAVLVVSSTFGLQAPSAVVERAPSAEASVEAPVVVTAPSVEAAPVAVEAQPVVDVAPVAPVAVEDEELAPLPVPAAKKASASRPFAVRARAAASKGSPPRAVALPEKHPEVAAPAARPADFSFLETAEPAPEPLKRPRL